jgi:hypothetical protein
MNYINVARIKKLAKQNDKRVGKDFLFSLDVFIEEKIIKSSQVHNGSKKTLDSSVFNYIFKNNRR